MIKVISLQRRTEAHDIEAQLNALRELQMQPAFIAGRQARRKKDIHPRLWANIFKTGFRGIIAAFKKIYRMKCIERVSKHLITTE
jgi:hypothetical protein